MMMNLITGLVTGDAYSPLYVAGAFLAVILGIILINSIISITLFIISCFRHDLDITEVFRKSFVAYRNNYRKLLPYYVPVIALWLILSVVSGVLSISDIMGKEVSSIVAMLWLIPWLIQSAYYAILDSSLAKSYYQSKEISFVWLSISQVLKLIVLAIIYLLMFLCTGLLLFIPAVLLGLAAPFMRYPIIVEDKGVFESIRSGFGILRKHFWDVVFFVGIYSGILTTISFTLGGIPLLQDIATLATFLVFQPFATLFFTEVYTRLER